MKLETVVGTLAEAYKSLRPGSILHVDEFMKERRTNEELRDQCFYAADGLVYSLQGEKKVPTLAITRASSNPLFQYSKIDEYCQQLLRDQNYRPTPDETQRALSAPDTVLVDLTKLRLQVCNGEFSYLAIDTRKYNKLNQEEQKLAQRVFGKGQDFGLTMEMLADTGIRETRMYVLSPNYVLRDAKENSLGRASWLADFNSNSYFVALGSNVDVHIVILPAVG